jgi:hypothetical protein
VGGLLFVSGKVPLVAPGEKAPKGKLGREFRTQIVIESVFAIGT